MSNAVTGLIGVVLIVTFLGYYAIDLGSIPLAIIIVAVLAMVIVDFVQSFGARNGQNRE
jgi:hypothetical protein